LLGAHLEVAASADELHDIVAKSPSDLVLVDTSGRAPTDEAGLEAALAGPRSAEEAVIWGDRERHVLLCLPAALRSADAGDLTRAYGLTKPTSVAITKIDLTTAPGGLLIASDQSNLPISTLCTGQRVPEDISPASAGAILGHLAADRTRGSKS
ncbi:MAG: hypothetical protein KC731_28500, partial [Myxococcales bacterium]|nr:hypothetical protein [Myxococcales bacterium]